MEMKIIKRADLREIPHDFTGVIKYVSGGLYWYKDGNYHREDGPAIEYPSGHREWYLNGKFFKNKEDWLQALTPEQQFNALWSEGFLE